MSVISIFFLLPIIIQIILGVFIYKDANSNGMNGVLWALVVFLVPWFIGLIVYLVVRSSYSTTNTNNKYFKTEGNVNNMQNESCKYCGKSVNKGWNVCPYCSNPIDKGIETLYKEV
ncbi:hypothetical protein SH2C18_25050 [Clostridium sediminicola]|uniref:hypothetical protein n=1 Tax=Clostridium sediminicola TaxID=3114879 RepID=UPI0031F1EEF8